MPHHNELDLFGASRAWNASDWTASDDRVRGGKSQSYLDVSSAGNSVRFHGNLETKTLGGPGFASQRTVTEDATWDLSAYDGIRLEISASKNGKIDYTFILKDALLPANPDNGREQATTSWEKTFAAEVQSHGQNMFVEIPWAELEPTYRGKPKENAGHFKPSNVKRFSFMVRGFFGSQEGEFDLNIKAIKAYKGAECRVAVDMSLPYHDDEQEYQNEKMQYSSTPSTTMNASQRSPTLLANLCCCFCSSDI